MRRVPVHYGRSGPSRVVRAAARGISVPLDTFVTALQDLAGAAVTCLCPTTVRLPCPEVETRSAEALARWVEDAVRAEPECFDFAPIPRDSTEARRVDRRGRI